MLLRQGESREAPGGGKISPKQFTTLSAGLEVARKGPDVRSRARHA